MKPCPRCHAKSPSVDWESDPPRKTCANCGYVFPPIQNIRNQFDHRGSLEIGTQAEELFEETALAKGYQVYPATTYCNGFEHWDFEIKKDKKAAKVEVKAMKRVDAWDDKVQEKWIWIELHGVRPTDQGWLHGRADLIAFEQSDHFIIVKRTDLKDLVNQLIMDKMVDRPSQAEYKIYQRPGRKDKITMIKASDLSKTKIVIWRK